MEGLEMCAETGGLVMTLVSALDIVCRRRVAGREAKLCLLWFQDRLREDGAAASPTPLPSMPAPSLFIARNEGELERGGVG